MNGETRRKFLIRSIRLVGATIPIIYYGCDSGGSRGGPLGPSGAGVFTEAVASASITLTPLSVTLTKGATQTFTATGGTESYTWSITNTALGSINISTGEFTAGATAATLTVKATDANGVTGSGAVTIIDSTITVTPAVVTIPSDITVNGATPSTTAPYTMTFTASGGTSPYTYNLSDLSTDYTGALMDLTTGELSVSSFPTENDAITVTATDAFGDTGTASLTIEKT